MVFRKPDLIGERLMMKQRKSDRYNILLPLILLAFFGVFSCTSPATGQGSDQGSQGRLVLSFGSRSRTIAPSLTDIEAFIDQFTVILDGPGGESISTVEANPSGSLAETFDLGNFAAGNWLVSVFAQDSAGISIAEKLKVPVVIPADGSATVDVNLGPSGGVGGLSVEIQWPGTVDSPSLQGTFQPQGGASTTLDFSSITTSGQSFSLGSLSSGNYLLTVFLYDGEVKLATKVEAVQIFSGIETHGTITFATADVNQPPGPVTDLTQLSPNGGAVTLQWETTDPYTKGYIIERRIKSEVDYSEVIRGVAGAAGPFGTSAPFEFVDTLEQDLGPFNADYRIRAYNTYGESASVDWSTFEIGPLNVPVISGLGWDTYDNSLSPTWTWTNPNLVTEFGVIIEDGGGLRTEVPVSIADTSEIPTFTPSFAVQEGEVTLTVRDAGEPSAGTYTAFIDRAPPSLSFDVDPVITKESFTPDFTVGDTGAPVNSGVDEYQWSISAGGTGQGLVNFSDDQAGNTSIFVTDSGSGVDGTYRVDLQVTDRAGNTVTQTKEFIWDQTAPVIPVIDPILTNSVYDMPALTIVDDHISNPSYTWAKFSGPGDILFTDQFSADTSIGANSGGDYVLLLTVFDDARNSSERYFDFHWDDQAPNVEAGLPIITNGPVSLNGLASDGPTALSAIDNLEWSIVDIPSSTSASLTVVDSSDLSTEVSANEGGVYTLRLSATDTVGLTASDTTEVRFDFQKPTVDLKTLSPESGDFQFKDLEVIDPLENGYSSADFSYQWTTTAAPATSAVGNLQYTPSGNDAMPLISVIEPQQEAWDGIYTIQLVVTDAAGNTSDPAIASVLIDHNPPSPGAGPTAGNIAANSFEISWDLAEDTGDEANLVYRIGIAGSESDVVAETGDFTEVLSYGQAFSKDADHGRFVIDGLNSGQEYWFKLQVQDSVGNAAEYPIGSETTLSSLRSGTELDLTTIQDQARNAISASINDGGTVFDVSIDNSVDKSRIIPVFTLGSGSEGASIAFDTDPGMGESYVPVVSGVTELDLSQAPNVFRVTPENGGSPQLYEVNLLYTGTELQVFDFIIPNRVDDQPVGVDGDPMDGQGLIDNGAHTISMTIPFLVQSGERLEGAFYFSEIQASSGATVSLNGGQTLVSDPDSGQFPGDYSSPTLGARVDYMDAGNAGILRPSFVREGLGRYQAEILVTAENGSSQVYNLTVQEDYLEEIPNGAFMMIMEWPTAVYSSNESSPAEIWRSGEFNRFGLEFLTPRHDQPYRTVYWNSIVEANINYQGSIDYDNAFEVQFLDGNNFTDSDKYGFVGIDNDYINTNLPIDERILIDGADDDGVPETIADGDVAILTVTLPNTAETDWTVDAYAIDRSDN
jgi:hypothetical protein